MEKKFTKGEWYNDAGIILSKEDNEYVIANTYANIFGSEERHANAKLIESAPELLYALIALVNGCLSDSESDKVVSLRKAKEVIKKATE